MKPTESTTRIRQSDMEEAIFRPNKVIENDDKQDVLVFCIFGNHDELTNLDGEEDKKNGFPLLYDIESAKNKTLTEAKKRPEACAYCIYYNKKKRYYVKRNTKGQLLNPLGLYTETEKMKSTKYIGRNTWEYKEVNLLSFQLYLKFLKTKNTAWIAQAERELN